MTGGRPDPRPVRVRKPGDTGDGLVRSIRMTCDDDRPWTDRSRLRDVQYRTDANLAARQSLYRWQRPRLELAPLVFDLAAVRGAETVADVGCGNGAYLAELARRRRRWSRVTLPHSRCAMTSAT